MEIQLQKLRVEGCCSWKEAFTFFFFFNFSFSGQYCIHIAQNLKGTTGCTPECFPSVLPLDTRSFSQRQPELQVLECLFRPVLCVIQTNTQRTPFFYMESSTLALFTACDRSLSIRKSFLLSFTTGEYSIVRMCFYLASAVDGYVRCFTFCCCRHR